MKPLVHSVWVGIEDENDPIRGFIQKLEYECKILEKKKQNERKEAERIKQHTTPREPVEHDVLEPQKDKNNNKKGNEQNGKQVELKEVNPKQQPDQRGRELHKDKYADKSLRGKSAPPKQIRGKSAPLKQTFKPTGVIFGVDKPHPANYISKEDSNIVGDGGKGTDKDDTMDMTMQEIENVINEKEGNKNQDKCNEIVDTGKEDNEIGNQENQIVSSEAIETMGTPSEITKTVTYNIRNPNELQVVINQEEWQTVSNRKKRRSQENERKDSETGERSNAKDQNKGKVDPNQQGLTDKDKVSETDDQQQNVGKGKNEKENPPDEWAEADSTEEDTSDESSVGSMEKEEEQQGTCAKENSNGKKMIKQNVETKNDPNLMTTDRISGSTSSSHQETKEESTKTFQ
ncbi:uncharacterized protein LOC132038581 [Lycium ferocissimum]|uniref:uncharacterized protein LOC132038581 n=1 Tax=Lycium ferocissimum TaxID=112874 RepID=UPI002815CF39|nr:uncharacterized protein LOC132038581 [Lycium ferocissimum]